jgi:hypothetical protein
MLFRTVRFVVLVGVAWVAANSLPDVARYVKMRTM